MRGYLANRPERLLFLLLLVLWALLTLFINSPWFGHHDANGVWLGAAARNLRLYGPAQITLVPLLNRAPVPPDIANYYVNHPPLIVWVTALAQTVFGDYEMSMRLVSIFSTMVSVAAFYVMCRRLYGDRHGLVCTALYALTPMIAYFGRMPNHEPLALAFIMSFGALFVAWMQQPTSRGWWAMVVLTVFAVWTAWASLFVVLALCVFALWAAKPAQRLPLLLLGAVALLALASIVFFYSLQYPETLDRLIYAFSWRTSTRSEISESFTFGVFIGETIIHLIADCTIALLVLALLGFVPALRQGRRLHQAVLLAFGAAGLGYILVFRSASYVHDYYKIFLMPFLAIAASCAVVYVMRRPRWRRRAEPALVALFLVSTVTAILFSSKWYEPSRDRVELLLAEKIAANTTSAETIFTNADFNPPLEYYAFRKMVWNIKPDEVDAMAAVAAPAVYLDCAWLNDPSLPPPATPAEALAACTIIHLPR
ncbi:MAG: glycosyltransferase family 39 protein [Anaerolineae bacterium]